MTQKIMLVVNCSPRENGQTAKLLEAVGRGAEKGGMRIEEFRVEGRSIHPCRGCGVCETNDVCVIGDDMEELYQLLKIADAVVFGTPVYWFGMTAQAKIVLDRMHACKTKDIKAKVGGIIVAADSSGVIDTIKDLLMAFATMGIIVVDSIGNYAPVPEAGKALQASEKLGEKIAEILEVYGDTLPDVRIQHIVFGTHTK